MANTASVRRSSLDSNEQSNISAGSYFSYNHSPLKGLHRSASHSPFYLKAMGQNVKQKDEEKRNKMNKQEIQTNIAHQSSLKVLRSQQTQNDKDLINQYIIDNCGGPFMSEDDIFRYFEGLDQIPLNRRKNISTLAFQHFQQEMQEQMVKLYGQPSKNNQKHPILMNEEDLFHVLNNQLFPLVESGLAKDNKNDMLFEQQPKAKLNNFNHHEKQPLYDQKSEDEGISEDSLMNEISDNVLQQMGIKRKKKKRDKVIKRIQDIFIQPNDFIFENPGKIRDHYRIGQVIGSGTYAQVRLCIHKSTGTQRALKVIPKNRFNPDQENILKNEVKIHKQLDHPNITKMFEYFKDESRYYIIMEIISGGDLYDKIKRIGPCHEAQTRLYLRQILQAINYMHCKEIVHRDIKPENLLVDASDNSLQLIDFGLSIKLPKGQKLSDRQGTPYYLAPEVLNKDYDHKCDIWSAGVIFFTMLTGKPPFNADSDLEIMRLIKIGKYSMKGRIWPDISS